MPNALVDQATASVIAPLVQQQQHHEMIGKVRSEVQHLVELQKIVAEHDEEELGVPETQAALEIVNHFNEDMSEVQSNMNTLAKLMDQMETHVLQ